MLTPRLVKRLHDEVIVNLGFELDTTTTEFKNAAKFLKENLNADDDDIIELIRGIATAVCEEYEL